MFDTGDDAEPVIAAANGRVLVITAGEIAGNAAAADRLFPAICGTLDRWIRTGKVE
jgi:hypothetical protein